MNETMKLPLVFDAPTRGKPPRHFADLDDDARSAAITELGLPAFRGKQLANQCAFLLGDRIPLLFESVQPRNGSPWAAKIAPAHRGDFASRDAGSSEKR